MFFFFFQYQTELCMFEVWDIPWQGTSTLVKQKCQPKGQSGARKQPNTWIILDSRLFCYSCLVVKIKLEDIAMAQGMTVGPQEV